MDKHPSPEEKQEVTEDTEFGTELTDDEDPAVKQVRQALFTMYSQGRYSEEDSDEKFE